MSTAASAAAGSPPADEPAVPAVRADELVDYRLVKAFIIASCVWLFLAPVAGFLFAVKFSVPHFLNLATWTSGPLIRQFHVNGVIFGWFTSATIGLSYYICPKLCGRPIWSVRLGWWSFWIYSLAFLAGEICILAQYTQGIELGEFPLPVDIFFALGFVTVTINLLMTILTRREKQIYVALWYLMAAYIWTCLNWCVGNFLLPYAAAGPNSAALHGFYLHNLVGLWITPSGLAIIYYFLPPAAKNPLFSHKLSILGFWSLAFFYPFNGTHHYIFSPIDAWVQTIAIVASMFLFIPVWAVCANFFGTLRGHWALLPRSGVLKFLIMGAVFYLIGCAQGPIEALRTVQAWTHFSDFVIGHSHVTIFGTFTFWAWAGIYFVWPRMSGRQIWSSALVGLHFWLATLGFTLMFLALTISGFVQNAMLHGGTFYVDSIVPLKIWWLLRSVGGGAMVLSMWVFMFNIYMTSRHGKPLVDAVGYRDYMPAATERYSRPWERPQAAPQRLREQYDRPIPVALDGGQGEDGNGDGNGERG
ncbi:MAG: Cbb3-type cytochrome c oxidase subunit CcoN1 [Phycisphaerae bacterium]|nr:Cbb3-type cytochrome c oxidase subunit CcoN1 [Phycisphaerae bacterium]